MPLIPELGMDDHGLLDNPERSLTCDSAKLVGGKEAQRKWKEGKMQIIEDR